MKAAVENLAQENLHLRTENKHLKGTRKSTVIKIGLGFMVLFLFALYVISRGTESHIQNSTQGEALVVNIALDGTPSPLIDLKGKTTGSYENIKINFQYDKDYVKAQEEIFSENVVRENSESSGITGDQNVHYEESDFAKRYLQWIEAMKEDIVPRKYIKKTEIDHRIDAIMDEVRKEVMKFKDVEDLARDVENLILEESEIRQISKNMYEQLKGAVAICREIKETDYAARCNNVDEISRALAEQIREVALCGELTTIHNIRHSWDDAIKRLQKCDLYINSQRFLVFLATFKKVKEKIENEKEKYNFLNSSSYGNMASIMVARFGMLVPVTGKFKELSLNIIETGYIIKKIESTKQRVYEKCLQSVLREDLRASPIQNLIKDMKEILEVYLAMFKI